MFSDINTTTLVLLALWSLPWKGVALWKASRLSHKKWFIVLLLINSLAILEIFYIFFIADKYEVKSSEVLPKEKK